MYIPKDREISINLPIHHEKPESKNVKIESIVTSPDKKLIAVATKTSIQIWLMNPQLFLCSIVVNSDVWKGGKKGELRKIYWRPDSSAIAVTTDVNLILIYSVNIDHNSESYNCRDVHDSSYQRNSAELFHKFHRPVIDLRPVIIIKLAAVPTCCVVSREEILVFVSNSFTHHVSWQGVIDTNMSFRLSSIPFTTDQLQSKAEHISNKGTRIIDAVYAPLIGGYSVVISDGRAALLTSPDPNFSPNTIMGVWAFNLKDATCCDVNHKFLLLLFGCANGDVCAYNIDEYNGSLIPSFRVTPKVTNGPDFTNRLGSVFKIRAISNGYGFAAIWEPIKSKINRNEDEREISPLPKLLAVFTSFGAQTFCNLEGIIEEYPNNKKRDDDQYTALDWGVEGYHLWLGTRNGLKMQSFVKNAANDSPNMEHCDRAVLISGSQVLISPNRKKEAEACAPHSVWDHVAVTHDYLSANWPIKFASTDRNFNHLVVAGERGFAYCALNNKKWKIFGNESQERNLIITGGVFIWNDCAIGSVGLNPTNDKPQLAFHPINQRLDDRYASIIDLEIRCNMVSVREDVCAVFDIYSQITLFKLNALIKNREELKVVAEVVTVIRINEIVPHPACVVSLQMTKLNLDVGGKATPVFYSSIDTVLINIAGRLITLTVGDDGKLHQPIVIASYVEKMWHDRCTGTWSEIEKSKEFVFNKQPHQNNHLKQHNRSLSNMSTPMTSTIEDQIKTSSSHLSNALWIACGAKGIKVWMPLIPAKKTMTSQEMTFIAKRIMLPFELDIYPIVIHSKDCLAIGVESQLHHVTKSAKLRENVSMYGLHRNSEVFVHHLLRQLLKRNLGVFALELAAACRSLPHFSHALELLLHGVLEEEATSSEPIPDPLLPRCLAFIHEFPEFLRTVAHCARKTELALWPALFDVTGSPNALFEECLQKGQLENAASFVIVLQNFESTEKNIEQISRLVRDALEAKKWTIALEMIRFARSIGPEDIDAITPPPSSKTSLSRRPTVSSPGNEQTNEFVLNRFQAGGAARLVKVRHSQNDGKEMQRKDSSGSGKDKLTRATSGESLTNNHTPNRLAMKMNTILEEHCWHLLNNYWIRDLGYFLSELQFNILDLLETRRKHLLMTTKTQNLRCFLIDDFALALTRLHAQFSWPYPVVGTQFIHQIEKKLGALKTSQSNASLNELNETENLKNGIKKMGKEKEKVKIDGAKIVKNPENDDRIEECEEEIEIYDAILEKVTTGIDDQSSPLQSTDRSPSLSSINNTGGATSTSSETKSLAGDWQSVDFLMGEKLSQTNTERCRQVDYMLNLFCQSAAIDWIFLLCLLSRDEKRLREEINPAIVKKVGEKNFARIRFACEELARWAIEKCCGYVTLLQVFEAHLSVVAEQAGIADLKWANQQQQQQQQTKKERKNVELIRNNGFEKAPKGGKLGSSFGEGGAITRRERSRSVDRMHRSIKKYDDVVCAEDVLEKADEDGCSIM